MNEVFIVLDHVGRSISNSAISTVNITVKDIQPSSIDDHQTYGSKKELIETK